MARGRSSSARRAMTPWLPPCPMTAANPTPPTCASSLASCAYAKSREEPKL